MDGHSESARIVSSLKKLWQNVLTSMSMPEWAKDEDYYGSEIDWLARSTRFHPAVILNEMEVLYGLSRRRFSSMSELSYFLKERLEAKREDCFLDMVERVESRPDLFGGDRRNPEFTPPPDHHLNKIYTRHQLLVDALLGHPAADKAYRQAVSHPQEVRYF